MTKHRQERPLKIWRIPRWIALISLSRSEGIGLVLLFVFAAVVVLALTVGVRDLLR